MPSATTGL
jgi:predicted Rossmann fold nucleotide-binding protein DprA/Smf involved in DNA uptake